LITFADGLKRCPDIESESVYRMRSGVIHVGTTPSREKNVRGLRQEMNFQRVSLL
jgi:hypothetical protein